VRVGPTRVGRPDQLKLELQTRKLNGRTHFKPAKASELYTAERFGTAGADRTGAQQTRAITAGAGEHGARGAGRPYQARQSLCSPVGRRFSAWPHSHDSAGRWVPPARRSEGSA